MNLPPTEQPEPRGPQSQAESLYARHLAGRGRGGAEGFDELCARHPELAAALRELDARQRKYGDILGGASSDGGGGFFRREERKQDPRAGGLARHFDPGEQIGDFKLVRFLGHGGMGQVWEATQLSMRRAVALKFVLPGRADDRTLSLFEREARAGGKTSHPNLVRTLARGEADGVEWIAQELVAGSYSLRDAIEDFRREGALPKEYYLRAAQLVRGIALGLQAAHEAGVIHRDIKPQNILIDQDDQPKVADFGLARVVGDSVLSQKGDFAGTYHYMSPEQLTAKRMGLDHRTDIFSLGVVMYELLTLARPFDGDTTEQISEAIITTDPPDPAKIRAQCPRDLAVICAKAMQKRPGARYASMKEFAEDIERHLNHEPILARPASRLEKIHKWILRHPAQAVAIGIGSTALVVISGVALYARGQAERADAQAERADAERVKTAESNRQLETSNARLRDQAREQKLRGMIQDLARFRAQCRTLDGLDRLGKPAYEWWLDEAERLLNGVAEDRDKGIEWQPGLADVRAKLSELRASRSVLPYKEDDRTRDFDSHPERRQLRKLEEEARGAEAALRELVDELEQEIARLESRLRGQVFPADADVAAKYAAELASSDASALNKLVWPLVDPDEDRPEPEQLVRAMLLARRGVEVSSDAESRALVRDTYAWSLLWLGRGEEALAAIDAAIAVSGTARTASEANKARIKQELARWSESELAARRAELAAWREEMAAWSLPADLESRIAGEQSAVRAQYEARLAPLREESTERRTWRFTDSQLEWWHEQLQKLEGELVWLSQMNGAAIAAHRTEKAQARWSEAIEGIARAPKYAGQRWPSGDRLTPQLGLLPLGENPATGLWEFVHLQTGTEPQLGADGRVLRDAEGRLSLTAETGMVLVLLPGGRVPKADSGSQYQEDWIPAVELSAFFLSKYELTAEQWDRVSLRRGMHYRDDKQLTPANVISWDDISAMWPREIGWCGFPSETQWEYGCRAGTATTWWTGNDAKSLVGAANVEHDDKTSTVIAPVGTLRGNGFGLHDVHGNVWEWCGDPYSADASPRAGDGLRDDGVDSSVNRVLRGGNWYDSPARARSAYRLVLTPEYRDSGYGLRPSRRITP